MKVAFLVSHYPSPTFPNRGPFFKRISESLIKRGVEVIVYAPLPYSNKIIEFFFKTLRGYCALPLFEQKNGVKIFRPRYFRIPFAHKFHFSHYFILRSMSKRLAKDSPDVIDLRVGFPGYPLNKIASSLSRKFSIPFIFTINGEDFPMEGFNVQQDYFDATCGKAAKVFTVSKTLSSKINDFLKIPAGVMNHPIEHIDLGNSKAALRTVLKLNIHDQYILYAGALTERKGVDLLLNAFKLIEKIFPDAYLLLAGDGPLKKEIHSNKVICLGLIEPTVVMKYMQAVDAFVFLTKIEAMPNVLKEAGLCKLPIVASKVGGNIELLDNGNRGFLVNPERPDEIVECLKMIFENEACVERQIVSLYNHIKNQYDPDVCARLLVAEYVTVIKSIQPC